MNSETIMQSDVLDILFENRNKAYGAYTLRKFYSNRVVKSLGIMLGSVLVLSAFTFLPDKKVNRPLNTLETTWTAIKPDDPVKEPEKKKDIVKTAKAPAAPVKTNMWMPPVIVPVTVPVAALPGITDSTAIGSAIITIPGTGPGIVVPANPGKVPGTVITEPAIKINEPLTEGEVDVMPSFPGGMPALRKFLEKQLTNPRDLEEDEAISVQVRFVVGYDGKLKDISIIKDGGDEFNKEVIRVVKKMPEWIPGKAKGQQVSVYYTIPVKFIPAG